ncbi:hypothetical protein [Brevibacterium oceani]|uniref:hypothetical protein n=1 Tax=Brevibacterium oceani TaxID=358099 RepID=UPI0015E62FA0|nr:hypothetical protein [Brevibacterium oceani]
MTLSDNQPLTAEELLASPRGRSFILGLATRVPDHLEDAFDEEGEPLTAEARIHDELGDSLLIAGFLTDKADGAGVAMYLGAGFVEPEPGDVTAADVVEKLREVAPSAPTLDEVESELGEVVDDAEYWQPPDGVESIAADDEVRTALMPFAETILATGLLDDWSRPLDQESQWALAWDDSEIHGTVGPVFDEPLGEVAEDRVIALDDLIAGDDDSGSSVPRGLNDWVADMLSTETERRSDFAKSPFHQLSSSWWSTPPLTLWSSTSTWRAGEPIGLSLVEDSLGFERARACRLRLRPELRICEIHRPEDWAELCRRYPLDVTAQQRSDWFETTGRRGRWVIPDWSRVAEEFDGVHVSLAGYLRTAGAVVDIGEASVSEDLPSRPTAGDTDERTASLMAGWNPDTTFWLGDVVTGIAEVAEWAYDDDADGWRQVPPR